MIVGAHASRNANDVGELSPALAALSDAGGCLGRPAGLVADAGYFSCRNVELCEDSDVAPFIAAGRLRHNRPFLERRTPQADLPTDCDAVERMTHRMCSAEGERIYAKRKSTVEPVFGIIKSVLGFRQFSLRGIEAVQGEWGLVCMAWNLKRVHRLINSSGAASRLLRAFNGKGAGHSRVCRSAGPISG